jgi:hypothetical protein
MGLLRSWCIEDHEQPSGWYGYVNIHGCLYVSGLEVSGEVVLGEILAAEQNMLTAPRPIDVGSVVTGALGMETVNDHRHGIRC